MVRESKGNNMSKKLTLAVIFTGVVAYLAYRRKPDIFYYIGKAEALRDELERKIAEKIQENVHS